MRRQFVYDSAPHFAYLFTGKERDQESGLDYFGARYYESSMGRFMSPDPSGLGFADPPNPQSLNLYSYVLNNPLINIDPTGMECVWDDGSFDSADDKDTGSRGGCSAQGGNYVDPSNFKSLNAGDWSNQPNQTIADVGMALNNSSTDVYVYANGASSTYESELSYVGGTLYPVNTDSHTPGDTSLALATAVAQDTRSLPWLCNAGLNARAAIPKTGIAVGGAVDRNGAHGSLNAQLAPLPGGASLNYTQTGSKEGAQVNVPIPDTPFRASAGVSKGRFNLGLSTGVPGTKNAVSAGATLSFGYLGDATCR